jgi:hypothetical protein
MRVEISYVQAERGDNDLVKVQKVSDDGRKDIGKAKWFSSLDDLLEWMGCVKGVLEAEHGIKI